MHSFEGVSCYIAYNSDLSGDIRIRRKEGGNVIEVAACDILTFVANYVRSERISKLEAQCNVEILGIKTERS